MIKLFRKVRQKLLKENKFNKYLIYAVGEIILVVIGILIALQINNWNENRIQEIELNALLNKISSNIQSDLRDLKLLETARRDVGEKADSIFIEFIKPNKKNISPQKANFINGTFVDITNSVSFKSNKNTFETLNNSTSFSQIQSSDLELLLNAYYTNASKISLYEKSYNDYVEKSSKEWDAKYRDNEIDQNIFLQPWIFYDDFSKIETRYLEILKESSVQRILETGRSEPELIISYEEQRLMGSTLIKMIKNSETSFDKQTKINFSGILYSFANPDFISVLIDGKIPTGFDVKYAASGNVGNYISNGDDHLILEYPKNTYAWGSPYFEVNLLDGRVHEMDFSEYTKLIIDVKSEVNGEQLILTMKDKNDPSDGSESKVSLKLTNQWKTYEIETSKFKTADKKFIKVPLSFVFTGDKGQIIRVRTVQFKKE